MIEKHCAQNGYTVRDWVTEDERPEAVLGRYEVVSDDYEDEGIYLGDTGTVTVAVVGAPEYHNQRVILTFTADGVDGGEEINDLSALDPVE